MKTEGMNDTISSFGKMLVLRLKDCGAMCGVFAVMLCMFGSSVDGAQVDRKKIAEKFISELDCGLECFRIEKSIASSLKVRVKHFRWNSLSACKSHGDLLGFLNAADDILNSRSDKTEQYKTIPDENTIRTICSALKKFRFRCEFRADVPLVFFVRNEEWERFIYRCMVGHVQLEKETGKILYRFDGGFSQFKPTGYLSEIGEMDGFPIFEKELIYVGAKGSIDKYAHENFKNAAENLGRKVANQEISMSEYRSTMLDMDKNVREKMRMEMMPIPLNAQEQVRTKDDFATRVLGLSFCIGDHLALQNGLLPYVHSIKIDETFLKLRGFQGAREWDRMVELLLPNSGSGDRNIYGEAWNELGKRRFPVQIIFTRKTRFYARAGIDDRVFCSDGDTGVLRVEISVSGSDPVCVYASQNGGDPLELRFCEDANQRTWKREFVMENAVVDFDLAQKIERKGFRDRSLLLERRQREQPGMSTHSSQDVIQFWNVCLCRHKLAKVMSEIKRPTYRNDGDKTIVRRPAKNLSMEIKWLSKVFAHPDFIDAYRKYGGEGSPEQIKGDWMHAKENVGDPKLLREEIKRRMETSYKDPLCKSSKELMERYVLYDHRSKGEDYRPDAFRKFALEDYRVMIYMRYSNLLNSLINDLNEMVKDGPVTRKSK